MIINILRKIFGINKRDNSNEKKIVPKDTSILTQNNLSSRLKQDMNDFGHHEFPFLHKDYSPNSRVPCTDFTPFIIDRMRNRDIVSIFKVIRGILASNPGLGIGPEWGDNLVRQVMKFDFKNYVEFVSHDAEFEIKALFIMAGKDGGGSGFWIADKIPSLFSYAMCCQYPQWKDTMEILRRNANSFIRKMRKDTPFWEEIPYFKSYCWQINPPNKMELSDILQGLSLSSRLHLLFFSRFSGGKGSLLHSTIFQMRSLGVNAHNTSKELLSKELCIKNNDPLGLLNVWTKDELVNECNNINADFRKSWNKDKLIYALQAKAPELIDEAIERKKVAVINPKYQVELELLSEYSLKIEDCFKLLCFI